MKSFKLLTALLLFAAVTVASAAEIEFFPTFHSCSVYVKSQVPRDCRITYREKGSSKWLPAFEGTWDRSYDSKWRTSIVDLKPDTVYEVQFVGVSGRMTDRASGTFRTWAEKVPVAKRIVLTQKQVDKGLVIKDKGTPNGWIVYTAAPGVVVNGMKRKQAVLLDNAEYVILENMTIRGGDANAVTLLNCKYVRLRNLDISAWCDPQNYTYDKGTGRMRNQAGRHLANRNAIYLSGGFGQVVERCYIHDPLMSSNNWRYGHPDGPQGISPWKPQSTVIRYNDICGSDLKWWNDGIAGTGNFDLDGGLNKDCDVYGNFIAFANDDCIELDGGQQNVRCFRNHFENSFMGISIQGCMTGPSFVFENRIVDLADEFMKCSSAIKTADTWAGHYAASYFYNNTTDQKNAKLRPCRNFRIVAKNNILSEILPPSTLHSFLGMKWENNLLSKTPIKKNITGEAHFVDAARGIYTLKSSSPGYGKSVAIPGLNNSKNPNVGAPAELELPYRPFGLSLADGRKALFTVKNGKASAPVKFTLKATAPVSFEVKKSLDSDWYEVSPAKLSLKAGETAAITVSLNPARMKSRINYRSVFFLRSPEGFSRPVTVMATTDYVYPENREGVQVFKPGAPFKKVSGGGVRFEGSDKFQFKITLTEKTGISIYMDVRALEPIGQHDSVLLGVNDEEPFYCPLKDLSTRKYTDCSARNYVLPKGTHTITVMPRESLDLRKVTILTDVRAKEIR